MSIDHSQAHNEQAKAGVAAPTNVKRQYKSPGLICYGSVGVLTQAGGTGSNEGSASGNMNMSTASDICFKENIARIGDHPQGFGLYLFDYKPEFSKLYGSGRQFGVMAQEVETVMPAAVVTHADGYKRVKYNMLGIERSGHRVH